MEILAATLQILVLVPIGVLAYRHENETNAKLARELQQQQYINRSLDR
jgi:hypothetical protein